MCVRRSAPTLVGATEVRRPVVMTVSYECPRKTSKCASLATRFSGYVMSLAHGNYYMILSCRKLLAKCRLQYFIFCVYMYVCVNVLIYIIIYVHICLESRTVRGREAAV